MKPLLDVIQRAPAVAQETASFDPSVPPRIDAEGAPPSGVGRKLSFGPAQRHFFSKATRPIRSFRSSMAQ